MQYCVGEFVYKNLCDIDAQILGSNERASKSYKIFPFVEERNTYYLLFPNSGICV